MQQLSDYAAKLRHPKWQRKRLEVMGRDGFRCVSCGADDIELHVHHLTYVRGREPWDYPMDNFRTLCKPCHDTERSDRAALEKRLIATMQAKGILVKDLREMLVDLTLFGNREFQDAFARFLDSFKLVFDQDWPFTCGRICEGGYIAGGATFLRPSVQDESNNWANRGSLLRDYRNLLRVITKNDLPIKAFFDDCEEVWQEYLQHELQATLEERRERIASLVKQGA